MLFEFGLFGH